MSLEISSEAQRASGEARISLDGCSLSCEVLKKLPPVDHMTTRAKAMDPFSNLIALSPD